MVGRRIQAEEEALGAQQMIVKRLNDTTASLVTLKEKISNLQSKHSSSLLSSLESTTKGSLKLRDLELLKTSLKDMQLILFEVQRVPDKKALIITRGRFNSAFQKAFQNDQLKSSESLKQDLKGLSEHVDEIIKLQMALFSQPSPETKTRY